MTKNMRPDVWDTHRLGHAEVSDAEAHEMQEKPRASGVFWVMRLLYVEEELALMLVLIVGMESLKTGVVEELEENIFQVLLNGGVITLPSLHAVVQSSSGLRHSPRGGALHLFFLRAHVSSVEESSWEAPAQKMG